MTGTVNLCRPVAICEVILVVDVDGRIILKQLIEK
jgi:hypothetical protein